jgi:Trypsin.
VERGVGRKVVHPKYNFFTYEYDLALVRLDSPLTFAPHIAPICLPASDDLLIGENATVTGWGRLSEGGTLPSILQEVRPSTCSELRELWLTTLGQNQVECNEGFYTTFKLDTYKV